MKSNKVLNVTDIELHILNCALTHFIKVHALKSDIINNLLTRITELVEDGSNILKRADKIVNEQAEEKERQYGNFNESIQRTCDLFNLIRKQNLTPTDVYWVLIALKLSREGITHREDNLLDAVAYMGALNNYLEK